MLLDKSMAIDIVSGIKIFSCYNSKGCIHVGFSNAGGPRKAAFSAFSTNLIVARSSIIPRELFMQVRRK
jgi:hypothetical protein